MRYLLCSAALTLVTLAAPAHADRIKVSFTGTNSSPDRANVFGTAIPTVTGYLIYDDTRAGTAFVVNDSRSAFNYSGAVTDLSLDFGSGIGTLVEDRNFGSIQVSDQYSFGRDRLSFNNMNIGPSLITGEPAGTNSYNFTLGLSGPFDALSSSDLPGAFDPDIFGLQDQLSFFVSRQSGSQPTGVAVSFNYNLSNITVENLDAQVPEPAALALFGLGLGGLGAGSIAARRKAARS